MLPKKKFIPLRLTLVNFERFFSTDYLASYDFYVFYQWA